MADANRSLDDLDGTFHSENGADSDAIVDEEDEDLNEMLRRRLPMISTPVANDTVDEAASVSTVGFAEDLDAMQVVVDEIEDYTSDARPSKKASDEGEDTQGDAASESAWPHYQQEIAEEDPIEDTSGDEQLLAPATQLPIAAASPTPSLLGILANEVEESEATQAFPSGPVEQQFHLEEQDELSTQPFPSGETSSEYSLITPAKSLSADIIPPRLRRKRERSGNAGAAQPSDYEVEGGYEAGGEDGLPWSKRRKPNLPKANERSPPPSPSARRFDLPRTTTTTTTTTTTSSAAGAITPPDSPRRNSSASYRARHHTAQQLFQDEDDEEEAVPERESSSTYANPPVSHDRRWDDLSESSEGESNQMALVRRILARWRRRGIVHIRNEFEQRIYEDYGQDLDLDVINDNAQGATTQNEPQAVPEALNENEEKGEEEVQGGSQMTDQEDPNESQ